MLHDVTIIVYSLKISFLTDDKHDNVIRKVILLLMIP